MLEAVHLIVMEMTLLIMENHVIVFLNFCGSPVLHKLAHKNLEFTGVFCLFFRV